MQLMWVDTELTHQYFVNGAVDQVLSVSWHWFSIFQVREYCVQVNAVAYVTQRVLAAWYTGLSGVIFRAQTFPLPSGLGTELKRWQLSLDLTITFKFNDVEHVL
jgi:hypothetical protein